MFSGAQSPGLSDESRAHGHIHSQVWYKVNSLKPWEEQLAVELGRGQFGRGTRERCPQALTFALGPAA